MFFREIEFSAHENYFSLKEDFPTPIKLNIPEWYKKLEHDINKKTVKGCMPFLDSITSGYLLKTSQDLYVRHNVLTENKEYLKDCFQQSALANILEKISASSINLNYSSGEYHSTFQLEGSNLVQKNKNMPFHKIMNPWKIKTPKGYSCLFVPPLNNSDDRFSIISGIVDTDTYPLEINFPIVINGDKYPILETIIKKGTPYVQIIPFKRDSWKMITKPRKQKEIQNSLFNFGLKMLSYYKEKYWNKKSWK